MRKDLVDNYNDQAIVLAFPDNWAKWHSKWSDRIYDWGISKNQYYKVGHAAILLVDGSTGEIEYFDFGRYTTGKEQGRVRSKGTDPVLELSIRAEFNIDREISNLHDIITDLNRNKNYTHGHGKVVFSVCKDISFQKAKDYIDLLIEECCINYSPFSKNATNCSRFVAKVIENSCKDDKIVSLTTKQSTYTATPIGNVINASYSEVFQFDKGIFRVLHLTRKTEFISMIKNLLLSSFLSNKDKMKTSEDGLTTPIKPMHIPSQAQWLSGIGEGAWISIQISQRLDRYIIKRFDQKGNLEYAIESEPNIEFDIRKLYRIGYNSNRLITSVSQSNNTIRFKYKQDFREIQKAKYGVL